MPSSTPVRNPRTGENDFFIEPYDRDDVEREAAHVRSNQPSWAADLDLRVATLETWRDELVNARGDIAEALTIDTGRRALSYAEVDVIIAATERWCRHAPELLKPPQPCASEVPGIELSWAYSPYPVVAVISPWNFPLILTLIDAVPALAAGCAVLAKASKVTPRFVEPLADSIARVPELDKVFRMIRGVGRIGSVMIDYADAVCFTGSIPVGRIVAHAAAERLIPAFLELGGKDAAIVTETPTRTGHDRPAARLGCQHRPGLPVHREHLRGATGLRRVRRQAWWQRPRRSSSTTRTSTRGQVGPLDRRRAGRCHS